MKKRIILYLVCLLLLTLNVIQSGKVYGSSTSDLLIGLDSVLVEVRITCEYKIPGFNQRMTQDRLQTICELELRNYGINVVSSGYPILDISFVLILLQNSNQLF